MALNKKKGSFTPTDPHGETHTSGKTGSGANSVRVVLLDGSILSVAIADKKMLGQVVFDQVVRMLDLLERDYFGLLYEDDHKTMQWLDLLKPIKKQLKKQPYTVSFRVKFYAVDPLALHRNSKEQFYLQLKEDIRAGRLPFPSESAHSILSYVLQADTGDYCSKHEGLHYLQEKGLLVLGKDRTAESSIIKLHKLLQGKAPDIAVEKFLWKTQELDSYGAKFHHVQCEGVPHQMSLSPSGITLLRDSRRTAHFKWRKVLQVSYKHKRFTLKLKSKTSEGGEKTLVYEVESAKLCKEMWEQCVERVSFYNGHPARYKETASTHSGSRSPSPPITRDYATINDATPHLEAARQQASPPTHSSPPQGEHNNPQLHNEHHGHHREEGRGHKVDKGSSHVDRGSQDEHRMREAVRDVGSERVRVGSSGKRDRRYRARKQRSHSPQGNGVSVSSDDRDASEGDAMNSKRQSNTHSKALSLPRRLPTGDPMLHHMMQFQNLEAHSNLFSESDSNAETTSPIVSTCDEASVSPEPTVVERRGPEPPSGGVTHLHSLPASQADQLIQPVKASQNEQRDGVGERAVQEREMNVSSSARNDRKEHNESVQDHSISEEREGVESIQDSLQELADLLGDDEEVSREMNESQNSREEVDSSERASSSEQRRLLGEEGRRGNQLPLECPGVQNEEDGEGAVTSSPLLGTRDEREKKRRQKQLQKQILLQRQQMKEQKLQQYLEKQKQKETVAPTKDLETKPDRVRSHEHRSKSRHDHQPEDTSVVSKSHPRDIRSRERGQHSLKSYPHHQSHQEHSPHPMSRHRSDTSPEQVVRERKMEERDMVRSWAKAQRKAQKEGRPIYSGINTSSALDASPQTSRQHNHSNPTAEPIYNRLAPKEDVDSTAVVGSGKSLENLPSSPPPPPYKSPSPAHQPAVGDYQTHLHGHYEEDSSTGMGGEVQSQQDVRYQTESLTRHMSLGSHGTPSTSTPPTPRLGAGGGSHSTHSNSPRSLSGANRSPRHTHSFSGGQSAGGSSPRTPTRAYSYKRGQHSPGKQQSPSLVPRRDKEHERQVVATAAGVKEPLQQLHESYPAIQQERTQLRLTRKSIDQVDEMPINIDPSALQKEDLTIASHNFLSPPYDKLEECEVEKPAAVIPITKTSSAQSGTQYNLETALQEVMTSENLPPPPTHLLEISDQLEDIDYQDLGTPVSPTAMSKPVVTSRAEFELQQSQQQPKRGINPEMIAKSLDAPRKAPNPNYFPPHIAKFMSRVRNSSIDADDPTQTARSPASEHSFPESVSGDRTKPPDHNEVSKGDAVLVAQVAPQEEQHASSKFESRHTPDRQHYDIPRAALGRTVSYESTNRSQFSHPVTIAGSKTRSNTYTGRNPVSSSSYSLSRGYYTPSGVQQFATDANSRRITPSSPHTLSDHSTGGDHSKDQLKLMPNGNRQSPSYTQNGVGRTTHSRQPPPRGNRESDSIPNSPTFFTDNHPHRDETTPSPETQLVNQSFKDHLTSLQLSKGIIKGTNVMNWMHHSSDYWNSNKSVPLLRDPPVKFPSRPLSHPTNPLAPVVGPSHPSTKPVIARHPVRVAPRLRGPLTARPMTPVMPRPHSLGSPQLLIPYSASSTSLHRNLQTAAVPEPPQSLPNFPRPNSAAGTAGDNFYILDV